jgi:hypothetical protein
MVGWMEGKKDRWIDRQIDKIDKTEKTDKTDKIER